MTCHHAPGDRSCATQFPEYNGQAPASPDVDNFKVLDAYQYGNSMVLKVQYPNCRNCEYEGTKVLVYDNCTPLMALKWKRIDPHFADPKLKRTPEMAPSPTARFPASEEGWAQALWFIRNFSKSEAKP